MRHFADVHQCHNSQELLFLLLIKPQCGVNNASKSSSRNPSSLSWTPLSLPVHHWQHCLAISWRVSVGVGSIGACPFPGWCLIIQGETATSGIALLWAALLFVPLLVEVSQQDVGLFSCDHLIRWVVTSGKVHRWPSNSGSAGWVCLEAGEVVLVVRRQALQELCCRHFYGMTVSGKELIGFQVDGHCRRFGTGKFGPCEWHWSWSALRSG